jgi:hypothetical protein
MSKEQQQQQEANREIETRTCKTQGVLAKAHIRARSCYSERAISLVIQTPRADII